MGRRPRPLAVVMVVSATAVAVNRGGDGNSTLSIDLSTDRRVRGCVSAVAR